MYVLVTALMNRTTLFHAEDGIEYEIADSLVGITHNAF